MAEVRLEHANVSVSDVVRTAQMLGDVFGWRIRWQGPVMEGAGTTIHVGGAESYVALYQQDGVKRSGEASYGTGGG
jgi:hypothetical protein